MQNLAAFERTRQTALLSPKEISKGGKFCFYDDPSYNKDRRWGAR